MVASPPIWGEAPQIGNGVWTWVCVENERAAQELHHGRVSSGRGSFAGNPFGGNYQVFIRALNGTITTFATGTNSPCCTWSWPTGINLDNAIVGVLNDGYNINHGFFRASNGSITTFDAPGAGVGFGEGTVPVGITSLGEITGRFIDSNRVAHGFILIPAWSGLSSAR